MLKAIENHSKYVKMVILSHDKAKISLDEPLQPGPSQSGKSCHLRKDETAKVAF